MLIHSHRHTTEDMRLWAELENADKVTMVPRELIEKTIQSIRQWNGDYIGCSWGKDSVVLLNLACRADGMLPVVWVRMKGRDNPDCETVRDAFLQQHQVNYYERVFNYDECGHDEHWRAVAGEFGPRRMTGIRADESGIRRMSVRHLGTDTGQSFRPLAWWRQSQIFGYLAQNDLPVHPAYAMLGGGRWPREHLRTHGIGGVSGTNRGRRDWEQNYYGDILNRLAAGSMVKC